MYYSNNNQKLSKLFRLFGLYLPLNSYLQILIGPLFLSFTYLEFYIICQSDIIIFLMQKNNLDSCEKVGTYLVSFSFPSYPIYVLRLQDK